MRGRSGSSEGGGSSTGLALLTVYVLVASAAAVYLANRELNDMRAQMTMERGHAASYIDSRVSALASQWHESRASELKVRAC